MFCTVWYAAQTPTRICIFYLHLCYARKLSTITVFPLGSQQHIIKWLPTLFYTHGTDRIHLPPPTVMAKNSCFKRLGSRMRWGHANNKKKCPFPITTGQYIDVGPSESNVKTVDAPGLEACGEQDATTHRNAENKHYSDTFKVSVPQPGKVSVQRTDSNGGWGMHLKFDCRVPAAPGMHRNTYSTPTRYFSQPSSLFWPYLALLGRTRS